MPGSRSRSAGTRSPTSRAEDFTIATVPALYEQRGDAGAGIDEAVGSLEGLLELSARHEAEGQGDAPWPPNYAKQAGEPPRVQPSRKRRADTEYEGRGKDGGRRPRSPRNGPPPSPPATANAGLPTEWEGTRPDADGPPEVDRSRSSRSRAPRRRPRRSRAWSAGRRAIPEAATHLEAADILVDGMRGRSSLWYRVRVNLVHVPEADRPAQEPLDPDYDPWAGYEWPDRAGQLERAPRKKPPSDAGGDA